MQQIVVKWWHGGMLALCLGCVPLCAQSAAGHKSLEDLLNSGAPKEISPTQETQGLWRAMISAFAQNDEKTGIIGAEAIMSRKSLLSPQQVELAALLLQLAKLQPGDAPPDAEIEHLKEQASQTLAEANADQREFDRLKAQADQLPKPYTYGSQTHVKMVELNNAASAVREKKEVAMKKYEGLRKKYEERLPIAFQVLELQISGMVDGLEAKGEIEDAIALCNTYLRKNASASQIAAKGEKLLILQKKEAHARELVAAVESSVKPLLMQHKLSAAEKELASSVQQIQARLNDDAERSVIGRLLKPLAKEVDDLLAEGGAKLAGARSAAADDPESAGSRLADLTAFWRDCPEIDSIKADIARNKRGRESQVYETKLAAISEMMKHDPASAKQLLRDFEKGLKPDDALLLKARLSGAWKDAWEGELTSIRGDMDEAHGFLTKIRADFTYLLERGDKESIRAALHASGSVENLVRAKGLMQGGLSRMALVMPEIQDPVLRSRAEGLRQSLQSSLDLLAEAENEAKTKPAPGFSPLVLISSMAGGMILLLGITVFTRSKKKPSQPAV